VHGYFRVLETYLRAKHVRRDCDKYLELVTALEGAPAQFESQYKYEAEEPSYAELKEVLLRNYAN
jgi:Retrotransposon gag protein